MSISSKSKDVLVQELEEASKEAKYDKLEVLLEQIQ